MDEKVVIAENSSQLLNKQHSVYQVRTKSSLFWILTHFLRIFQLLSYFHKKRLNLSAVVMKPVHYRSCLYHARGEEKSL